VAVLVGDEVTEEGKVLFVISEQLELLELVELVEEEEVFERVGCNLFKGGSSRCCEVVGEIDAAADLGGEGGSEIDPVSRLFVSSSSSRTSVFP
jgi:hypothetical protein